MKSLKRILFVIAIVALLATSLTFAVGAEYTTDNYDSILEYYEPMFGYESFDDKDAGSYTDGIINEWTAKQLTEIVTEGENKYLTLSSTSFPFYSSNLFLNMNADAAERLLLSFKVKGDRVDHDGNLPIVSVYLGDEQLDCTADAANAHNEGICLIKLDFNTGKVMYYTNRLKDYVALDGFTLSESTWYNVDVIYNVVDGGYSVSVVNSENEAEQVFKGDVRIPFGYGVIKNVRIGMSLTDVLDGAQSSVVSLDDVFAYSGSFYRDPTAKYDQTTAAFADFIGIIENPEVAPEVKIAVLNVYDEIVNRFGYVAEDDEAKEYVATLRNYEAMLYVNYVAACTDNIDPNGDYATRRANLDSVKAFYDAIPVEYSFLNDEDEERLESVKAEYVAESAYLASVEADCREFLEVFAAIDLTAFAYEDYPSVNGIYESVKDLSLIDFTYPEMQELYSSYSRIILNHDRISTSGEEFIKNINALQTASTFNNQYRYYRKAADVKETYINDTYPGVADALAVFNNFVNSTDILVLEQDAATFIEEVGRANFALYLSEKDKHYDLATPYLTKTYTIGEYELTGVQDCIDGVEGAKELYDAVAAYVIHATESATSYIEAVIALEGLVGDALEEAVNNALILKEEGDIEGFELTKGDVTYKMADINVRLSELATEISLAKSNCEQFVLYVNMIGKSTTLTERYNYIRNALSVKPKIDANFAGVSEAVALLDAEIASYKNDIAPANNSVTGGSAEESSAAVRSRAKVGPRVVAFVGSYGKEEQ